MNNLQQLVIGNCGMKTSIALFLEERVIPPEYSISFVIAWAGKVVKGLLLAGKVF